MPFSKAIERYEVPGQSIVSLVQGSDRIFVEELRSLEPVIMFRNSCRDSDYNRFRNRRTGRTTRRCYKTYMGEKPLRDLKRDVAEAIERVRRNGKDLRKIERRLQSNLKVLRELKQKVPPP